MKRKKLVIISHTEHYLNSEGIIVGWGSTVNEINYLADFWEEVIHIGCFFNTVPPENSLSYLKDNIRFVPISPFGGNGIVEKVGIFFKIPKITVQVLKNIGNASEIQLRLPTSMGIFLLPIFSFFLPRTYTFWVKYAGNWSQKKAPLSYKFQKYWLKNNFGKFKVTINGFWKDQPSHCFSFENPCLLETDIRDAAEVVSQKKFESPFTFVFVGRLDAAKGVDKIIEALKQIPTEQIKAMHFIGDGTNNEQYQERCKFIENKVFFHGFLPTEKVREILKESDFMLLPSKSEGFPKVIAEAACYGVIPIVSDVGSISHYINATNGFIWNFDGEQKFGEILANAIAEKPEKLLVKSKNLMNVAKMFTFENYRTKLEKYIFTEIKK